MNVKILLVGLAFVVVWPFILTPRWFGLAVDPAYVVVEGGVSPKDFDCHYFSLFGNSLSANCPPRNPPKALYMGPVEIKAGRMVHAELVQDRMAYEILLPVEGLLLVGIGLLSRMRRLKDEIEMNTGQLHETDP